MGKLIDDGAGIAELLKSAKVIAVVGVSDKPDRASNGVSKYLQDHSDYTLYFVNPLLENVLGQKSYKSLAEIPEKIDIVDVFRKVEDMPPILDEAISIGARAFWMQLGLRDEALANAGEEAGLTVVQDMCIKIEHQKI